MTGETADADAERAEYLVFMSGWMGMDLAHYGLDEPIGNVDSNAILSALKVFQSVDPMGASGRSETSPRGARSAAWDRAIVRSVVRVADTLQEWVEEIDVDGFTQPYAITPTVRPRRHRTRHIRPRGAESERCVTGMCPPVVGMAEGCDAHCGLQRRGPPVHSDPNQEARGDH